MMCVVEFELCFEYNNHYFHVFYIELMDHSRCRIFYSTVMNTDIAALSYQEIDYSRVRESEALSAGPKWSQSVTVLHLRLN